MKKWRGLEIERKEVGKTFREVGEILSKRFHDKAKELIIKLSKFKRVKITHLIMGMGGWSIKGTVPFKEIWSGGIEEGDHEIEFYRFDTGRNNMLEYYENVNPGICAVFTELNEILTELTSDPYLSLLDINEKEMKKLLAKK